MNSEILIEIYPIENKKVSLSPTAGLTEKSGKKMRQNWVKLLKKHIEKMSVFRLSKMLMKLNELNTSLQDVNENKGR